MKGRPQGASGLARCVRGARRVIAALGVLALTAGGVAWRDREVPVPEEVAAVASAAQIERGRVLALAGNCATCHTARGGRPYAGGRVIDTPFGGVVAGNLTPHAGTGLGRWTPGHFWRALHHGRGFDGRRLVPAFPYTETTRIRRADSDALFAYLRTLPAVDRPRGEHDLRWPLGTQAALAVWRVLFFRPGEWQDDPAQGAVWNRGAYLVNGVAHCGACHAGRNALGGRRGDGFSGALMPARHAYAPALTRAGEASVADWPLEQIVALLRDGSSTRGQASGEMAEVVSRGTQYLSESDLHAMAIYLKSIPVQSGAPAVPLRDPERVALRVEHGAALYRDHCAACHGDAGEGGVLASGERVVPALAGNRLVTMEPPVNLVRAITQGGFGAVTAARPRPFGMPPYAHVLSEEQIGAVATFLRRSWGAAASPVGAQDVARWRGGG